MSEIRELAEVARGAAAELALLSRPTKDAALGAMADALVARSAEILAANERDITAARESGIPESTVDRLALNPARITAMAEGLRQLVALDDPVGDVVREWMLPNGLEIRQVRVPLGVVAMIYEARPNVTVDAAGICLKSGNVALLRGSSSAQHSNEALVAVLRDAAAGAGVPADAILLVPAGDHESVKELLRLRGLIDVVIPRGGAGLIASVVEESRIPVIETGVGNCHVYVDADADLDMALDILVNAKVQRPSVCNAAESLLVHRDVAAAFLPRALAALKDNSVTVHGDALVAAYSPDVVPATDEDFYAEYNSLDIAAAVVDSLDDAIAHIRRYGSAHTDAIVTRSSDAAQRFVNEVDSAAVMVNASTRFTDGEQFGFGAEIGISTQKLHARGPMALPEMTSTKYIVTGTGQVRP